LNDPSDEKVSSAVLFPAGYALPGPKARNSTFSRPHSKPFEIELKYNDTENIPFGSETIGVCRIPNIPPRVVDGTPADAEVRVKFRADPTGTFAFVQADSLEEKEETIEVPVCTRTRRLYSLFLDCRREEGSAQRGEEGG
jgi:hypothetical protein